MATIRDVAARAGVSVATVSRTLRDPDAVRPVRRDRVRQAVEELGYAPNAIARQLRQPRNEAVIVIVPEIANPFFSNIVQAIENVAHDLGYRVLIGETQGKQERLDYYADMVLTRAADGLILLGSLLPGVVAAGLRAGKIPAIPLVLACERSDDLECPQVFIDNAAAARLATRHLLERGCRTVATITGPAGNTLSEDRLRGFLAGMEEACLPVPPDRIEQGDFSIDAGYAAMRRLLAAGSVPEGVFCANDEMAIGAQRAIREHGLAMPGDVAIIGFDDLRFGSFAVPSLSTIRQPTAALGETAMRMLDAVLQGVPIERRIVILPHDLIERESTAAG